MSAKENSGHKLIAGDFLLARSHMVYIYRLHLLCMYNNVKLTAIVSYLLLHFHAAVER